MRLKPEERRPGAWDYDGRCAPDGRSGNLWNESFSVGIFQWKVKAKGHGVKKGKVVRRIKGRCVDYKRVYKKAEELCKKLETEEDKRWDLDFNK